MSRRKLAWLALLFGLVIGSGILIVSTASFGGTPWRQMPYALVSALGGTLLTVAIDAVTTRAQGEAKQPRSRKPDRNPRDEILDHFGALKEKEGMQKMAWKPNSPWLAICNLDHLNVGRDLLIAAVEKYSEPINKSKIRS